MREPVRSGGDIAGAERADRKDRHRTFSALRAERKGRRMSRGLSPFCVYTIRHRKDLDEAYRDGKSGEFTENKVWRTGHRLFRQARRNGRRMPVVFACAAVTDGLLYHAVLSDLMLDEAESTTSYEFTHLTPIKGDPPLSTLRLRSTDRPLSDDYIRPYAICHTPSFISE